MESENDIIKLSLAYMRQGAWAKACKYLTNINIMVEAVCPYSLHPYMAKVLVQAGIALNTMLKTESAIRLLETAQEYLQGLVFNGCMDEDVWQTYERATGSLIHAYISQTCLKDAYKNLGSVEGCWLSHMGTHNSQLDANHGFKLATLYFDLGEAGMESGESGIGRQSYYHAARNAERVMDMECGRKMLNARNFWPKAFGVLMTVDPHNSYTDNIKDFVEEGLNLWKQVHYPLEEGVYIVKYLRHFLETRYHADDYEASTVLKAEQDLGVLHKTLARGSDCMLIPDTLTHLGLLTFHKRKLPKATELFESSLAMYRQGSSSMENACKMQSLLRYIGVASYNTGRYHRAGECYRECLKSLEKMAARSVTDCAILTKSNDPLANLTSVERLIADVCASIGFTCSRLRDFEGMLNYYQRALDLEKKLSQEDLELIQTNIGSLYFVKAVQLQEEDERKGTHLADEFFEKAERAFETSLKYAWKSFPFINYGYYLLCRREYEKAAGILRQGYLNGVIDKDTVEFDHTEDPILIEDLCKELSQREEVRFPSPVIALYLKSLSEFEGDDKETATQTAKQLAQEVKSCSYKTYCLSDSSRESTMEGACYSLVGYMHLRLGITGRALESFQRALYLCPGDKTVQDNIARVLKAREMGH